MSEPWYPTLQEDACGDASSLAPWLCPASSVNEPINTIAASVNEGSSSAAVSSAPDGPLARDAGLRLRLNARPRSDAARTTAKSNAVSGRALENGKRQQKETGAEDAGRGIDDDAKRSDANPSASPTLVTGGGPSSVANSISGPSASSTANASDAKPVGIPSGGSDIGKRGDANDAPAEASGAAAAELGALECAVCRELFCVPVTAACQHTFCQECIERLQPTGHGPGAGVDERQRPTATCPLCRRIFQLPPLSSRNLILERLVKEQTGEDKYKQRVREWEERKLAALVAREDAQRGPSQLPHPAHHFHRGMHFPVPHQYPRLFPSIPTPMATPSPIVVPFEMEPERESRCGRFAAGLVRAMPCAVWIATASLLLLSSQMQFLLHHLPQ